MARFTSQYKQTAPTRRIVSGENTYEKGMYYSDQALAPGYAKTLLNLEIDQLSGSLQVTGGLHTKDAAAGCTFLENVSFGQDDRQVVVLQARNEYLLRAFEGITNIISINKFSVKNNQTLEEKLRQQGFTPNDVDCYKILTHNPINNRMMSVTLIKAARDRHFVVDERFDLRRLNSNPISCGFSEVWEDGYVSNLMDYHPDGIEDTYVPRARRNALDETYGQRLHSPHYMQTVPHCEGFGNKTFFFTKKKLTELQGPIKDTSEETAILQVYRMSNFNISWQLPTAPVIGNIISISTVPETDTTIPAQIRISNVWTDIFGYGRIDIEIVHNGIFKNNGTVENPVFHSDYIVRLDGTTTTQIQFQASGIPFVIADTSTTTNLSVHDIYLRQMNTGVRTIVQPTLEGTFQPVDAFRYGIALTSMGIRYTQNTAPTNTAVTPNDANDLWDSKVADEVQRIGTAVSGGVSAPAFELNLNTGALRPTVNAATPALNLTIEVLPYLSRASGFGGASVVPVSDVFGTATVANWGVSAAWVNPWDWLKDSIKDTIRIGQGFRIAAYCRTNPDTLSRYLNTLRQDPLTSKYYNEVVESVFVLDYVWDGANWDFSFVDAGDPPTEEQPTLVENWDINSQDNIGNVISRQYIYMNALGYTDIVTEENVNQMATHVVDTFMAPKLAFEHITDEADPNYPGVLYTTTSRTLTQNPTETLQDVMEGSQLGVANRTKTFDMSYGHFEVTPKLLTQGEASRYGGMYNMLHPTPYLFENVNLIYGSTPFIQGFVVMGAQNTLRANQFLLKPLVNTPVELVGFYQANFQEMAQGTKHYKLLVEYKNTVDEWRVLKQFTTEQTHALMSFGDPIRIPFTAADENCLIRWTLFDDATKVEVVSADRTQTNDYSLTVDTDVIVLQFTKDPNQAQIPPTVFDLGTSTGLTYWKNRLVCWGVLNAESMVFMSEPDDPTYFPYPYNLSVFDESVVHVIPYSDALIVFTSTKLWRIDMQSDGITWRSTLLQQNLRISDKDIPYITILKNMLFFKSSTQFYMLVPSRGSTVGELTIAPISKAVAEFLNNPFKAIKDIIRVPFPELANKEHPINEYLIKYGVHTEQSRVFVDWWFDMSDWKAQAAHISERQAQHEVINKALVPKEYWLVQLIYDTQTYGWSLRTHTTPTIGMYIADAVNQDVEFLSLHFCPEWENSYTHTVVHPNGDVSVTTESNFPFRIGNDSYNKPTWGLGIAYRRTTDDSLLKTMTLSPEQISYTVPSYPRIQAFDTGYKEVSSPALKKRFREVQMDLQFKPGTVVKALAPNNFLETLVAESVPDVAERPDLVAPFMYSEAIKASYGDAVPLKALLEVFIDGHQMLSATRPEVTMPLVSDGVREIRIIDAFNFIETPFTVDAELSNTFLLDQSTLAGVKLVRFRKTINGKGHLVRMNFINLTEATYDIVGHMFVAHNKNAR